MRQGKTISVGEQEQDYLHLLADNPKDHALLKTRGDVRACKVYNLKRRNRDAYDANYFLLKVDNKEVVIQKDELEFLMRYV